MRQYKFNCRVSANGFGYVTAESLEDAKDKCERGEFDDIVDENDQEYFEFSDFELVDETD